MLTKFLDLSIACDRQLSRLLLLTGVGILIASPAGAVVVGPTSNPTVTIPTGTQNGTRNGSSTATAYIDDVLLNTITFSGTTFTRSNIATSNSFRDVQQFQVTAAPENINAEFGDSDNGSDGNPNPFVSAGIVTEGTAVPLATQESTDPAIQGRALQAAYNSLSLTQGNDGEDAANYTYRAIFDNGIVDNSTSNPTQATNPDNIPELIFFERGLNSDFSVRAITGRTNGILTYAPTTVTVNRGDMTATGIYIDTSEINGGQQLGVAGIDLNEFGISSTTAPVYGVEVSSLNTSGADIYGQFLTAADPVNQFKEQAVPEPFTILGSGIALGFGVLMQRQHARRTKQAS